MNKLVKRLLTGTLAFATILTALPVTVVHASGNQYWTESAERVGYIEHVMNDGSIKSTFHEGHMKVEGETAYCVDINTNFKNGYKTRSDASTRMSSDQIADVALSLEYVKQYTATHTGLNNNQKYLLEQCVVWQRLSEQLGWQCDNVRASYNEISQTIQNEVYAGAKAFVKANKGRYECGGYIYTGEGQDIGQFWAKLNVGNAKVKKTSSNPTVTDGNANYSFEGATFGVYSDKGCNSQLAIIQVESGGTATDVMQSSESLGLPPNSLSTEESIKQGCKYFASLLSSCKAKGMNDINVVIQSYNYGGGYADYVAKNGKKHNFNLAENFAKNKSGGTKVTYTNPIAVSKNGGWRYNYGNMFYVELVNQYLTVKQFSNETVQAVMNEALKYQGWKYVYGGSNPNTSFDCSGLTQWCYGKAGISLPRTAQAQYDATQHIPLSQAQAGDLVFFHSTYNTSDYVTHVGIYVGNNQMYHAGNPIGYTDLNSAYWQQHIICAGRIKQ